MTLMLVLECGCERPVHEFAIEDVRADPPTHSVCRERTHKTFGYAVRVLRQEERS
jgi:hypothetical protein